MGHSFLPTRKNIDYTTKRKLFRRRKIRKPESVHQELRCDSKVYTLHHQLHGHFITLKISKQYIRYATANIYTNIHTHTTNPADSTGTLT